MYKKHDAKVKEIPGGKTVLDETATLVVQKLDCIIMYVGTNGITKVSTNWIR